MYRYKKKNITIQRDQLVIIGAASLQEYKLEVFIIFMAKLTLNCRYCDKQQKGENENMSEFLHRFAWLPAQSCGLAKIKLCLATIVDYISYICRTTMITYN